MKKTCVSVIFAIFVMFIGLTYLNFLITSQVDAELYNRIVTSDQFTQMDDMIVFVETTTKYLVGEDKVSVEKGRGIGLKLNNNHFLFLNHVVKVEPFITIKSQFGHIRQPATILEYNMKINDREVVTIGSEYDIAVLKYKNSNINHNINIPVANMSEIEIGTVVYVTGFSTDLGDKNFKVGNISNLLDSHEHLKFNDNADYYQKFICLNIPIYPGDSGSILFVLNKQTKKMEIAGIIGLKGKDNEALAYRIDDIMESVRKIINGENNE